jgi:hypothetical protein
VADAKALGILKQGAAAWNKWRAANLSDADLSGANLSAVDLRRADLILADFHGANLSGANLSEADLSMADLRGANLSGANLSRANLSEADLSGADLARARVGSTFFVGIDLSNVLGLKSVDHHRPSFISVDTIYNSKGEIPEIFLRDAGVPEPFIVQMKALVGALEPIQFYSCFISYSSRDQEFAERLHADLQAKGVRCWFAPEDLKIGDHFQERIEESIRVSEKVMIVISEASVKSRWVEREVNAAREREDRDGEPVLFPIRLDEAVMESPQPWAAHIRRTRHIGNFSDWHQHPEYRKAFDRLLRDLKSSA